MRYFISETERKAKQSTCYHEFYKGKWDEKTFWKEDSICLHDELLVKGFVRAVSEIVPAYDPYGVTEISEADWLAIGEAVKKQDMTSQLLYEDASQWAAAVLKEYGCFTILGI